MGSIRRQLVVLAAVALGTLVVVAPANASGRLKIGIYEEALTLGNPNAGFGYLEQLRPQVLRLNLNWNQVAPSRPANPYDPLALEYDWSRYDQAIQRAQAIGAEVLLHVIGTPGWANGGRDWRYAPTNMADLHSFTVAAARRYSGLPLADGRVFPAVWRWAAWNEPNLSTFLKPTWARVGGRLVPVAARKYARICNAVWKGVHDAAREAFRPVQVACGVTSPYGKGRTSISPIRFIREMKRARAKFDVYAHHPYGRNKVTSPTTIPRDRRSQVSLGNIRDLFAELTRLYGKRKKLWITEYGYQTNPPDPAGVTPQRQAAWMRLAHIIARRHPRIDLFLWFLIQDEPDRNGPALGYDGWQSGLVDLNGVRKPAFFSFQSLPRL
jgi:hypothetical protein